MGICVGGTDDIDTAMEGGEVDVRAVGGEHEATCGVVNGDCGRSSEEQLAVADYQTVGSIDRGHGGVVVLQAGIRHTTARVAGEPDTAVGLVDGDMCCLVERQARVGNAVEVPVRAVELRDTLVVTGGKPEVVQPVRLYVPNGVACQRGVVGGVGCRLSIAQNRQPKTIYIGVETIAAVEPHDIIFVHTYGSHVVGREPVGGSVGGEAGAVETKQSAAESAAPDTVPAVEVKAVYIVCREVGVGGGVGSPLPVVAAEDSLRGGEPEAVAAVETHLADVGAGERGLAAEVRHGVGGGDFEQAGVALDVGPEPYIALIVSHYLIDLAHWQYLGRAVGGVESESTRQGSRPETSAGIHAAATHSRRRRGRQGEGDGCEGVAREREHRMLAGAGVDIRAVDVETLEGIVGVRD